MNASAIMAVSTAVIALTQIVKQMGVPKRWAPLVVLLFSAIGVTIYGYSTETFVRNQLFSYFSGWILVAAAAVGAYETARNMIQGEEPGRVTVTQEPGKVTTVKEEAK